MKRLGIIGFGWLAEQFYEMIKGDEWDIWATKREIKTDSEVELLAFDIYNEPSTFADLPIDSSDILLFTIPPHKQKEFAERWIQFFQYTLNRNPEIRIIFISSTSVYGDAQGEVDENSSLQANSQKIQELHQVEEFLIEKSAYVLRCGGLVGKSRHPVKYLAGRKQISKPEAVVNLVHAEDVNRFIRHLLLNDLAYGVYNLVSPDHPQRKAFYQSTAKKNGLIPPSFDEDDKRKGKIVRSKKAINTNFDFNFSSPFEMPFQYED